MEKRFEHFCPSCVFLGWHGSYDLYFCRDDNLRPMVLVARWGNRMNDMRQINYYDQIDDIVLLYAMRRAEYYQMNEQRDRVPDYAGPDMEFM